LGHLYRPLPLLTMTFDNPNVLSVDEAATWLGLSPQHVRRLVEAGELELCRPPGTPSSMVVASSVVDFEERRSAAERRADEFSRELDDAGAPPE